MKTDKTTARKWLRELGWFGGPEGAAIFAVALAIPFLFKRLDTIKRDANAFEQTRASDLFRVSLQATANVPIDKAFEIIVPIDVPSILPGYGILPAVVGIESQIGDWDGIGQTRIVRLADDTTAREEITLYQAPHRFGYKVSDWSGPMKFLARGAKSEWDFRAIADDKTRIEWNYAFAPRSVWTAWLLLPAVQMLWRGAMKRAMRECVRQVESSSA